MTDETSRWLLDVAPIPTTGTSNSLNQSIWGSQSRNVSAAINSVDIRGAILLTLMNLNQKRHESRHFSAIRQSRRVYTYPLNLHQFELGRSFPYKKNYLDMSSDV